ncbi:TPA: hypothetical protein N0F65_008288 [Lagenidium giganteum]|uniref:Uncharacterized protein n=1 Tax=Lagenidium giganteum TaxID=4803 RepID=A0AAV2YQA9_9STRA|nr:TPA: hypothetical protein N0F65_008288 [Lagenidium giganteum]
MAQGRKVVRVKVLTGRGRKPSLWVHWINPKSLSEFSRLRKLGLQFDSQLTGKKQVSGEKMRQIKEEVAIHLGVLQRGFDNGELNEDTIENINETHFMIDFHTRKALGFVGETFIKYANVVFGCEGMAMVVQITGGSHTRVMPPMMIFQNANESYPIRGVTHDGRRLPDRAVVHGRRRQREAHRRRRRRRDPQERAAQQHGWPCTWS